MDTPLHPCVMPLHPITLDSNLSICDSCEPDIQWLFLPEGERSLFLDPVSDLVYQAQVELVNQAGEDETHFCVSQTVSKIWLAMMFCISLVSVATYFLPRQFLGPVLKGLKASMLSPILFFPLPAAAP